MAEKPQIILDAQCRRNRPDACARHATCLLRPEAGALSRLATGDGWGWRFSGSLARL